MQTGDLVVIAAFDDVPEHWFRVDEVFDDCIILFSPRLPRKPLVITLISERRQRDRQNCGLLSLMIAAALAG